MRRTLLLLPLLPLLLASCGVGSSPGAVPTNITPTPVVTTPPAGRAAFLAYAHTTSLGRASDGSLLNFASAVCDELGKGMSFDSVTQTIQSDGLPAEEAPEYIRNAVINICPEQRTHLPG